MGVYDIRRFRVDKGIKQSELADILSVTQPYISEVEKGKKPLSKEAEEIILSMYPDFLTYKAEEEQSDDLVSNLIKIVDKQAEMLKQKDLQVERLIKLLENHLNK